MSRISAYDERQYSYNEHTDNAMFGSPGSGIPVEARMLKYDMLQGCVSPQGPTILY